jgi:hypothetical protein
MKIKGSPKFEVNSLDWHALLHRAYVVLAGAILTVLPQLLDPNINYSLHFRGQTFNVSVFVFAAVTWLISFLKRYASDNSNVTVEVKK